MLNRTLSDVPGTSHVVSLPPTASARDAAAAMSSKHVASVLVIDNEGGLKGIFTERDMITRVVAADRDPKATPLSEVMTPDPVTISKSHSVRQALVEMKENKLRHLPIMEGGTAVGVVSMRDFISDEVAELDHERELREAVWEHAR